MYFFLKEPKSDKETLIILQCYLKSEKKIFKYSTGIKVNPKDWNFNTRLPKIKRGAPGVQLKHISTILNRYISFYDESIRSLEVSSVSPTRELLKKRFDRHFKKVESQEFTYITDFVEDFIQNASNIINRTTRRKHTPNNIKQYRRTLNRIKDFENYVNDRIRIDSIDLKFYDKFVLVMLEKKGYSINSVGDLIKNIKVFLKQAEENGLNVCKDYHKTEFAVISEETLSVVLSEEEIDAIFNHDFTKNERLSNCRDIAIIGLWTGLRVSDFLSLPKIKKSDKFIEVVPKKTALTSGVKVIIPLHDQIKEIIEKRGMPRMISDVKFNVYIKEVCKEAGITKVVKGSLMDPLTKRKKEGSYFKYKLISSHVCRRSFATNLYKMKFPILSIMKITGHTSEKSFLKYIKITPREHAEKLLEHWNDYYSIKK